MIKRVLLSFVYISFILTTSASAISPNNFDPYGQALLAYIRTKPHDMLSSSFINGLVTGGQLRYYFIRDLCPNGSVDESTIHVRTAYWQNMLARNAVASINDIVSIRFEVKMKKYDFSNDAVDLASSGGFAIIDRFKGTSFGCSLSPKGSKLEAFAYPQWAVVNIAPGIVPARIAVPPEDVRRIIDFNNTISGVYMFHISKVRLIDHHSYRSGFRVATSPISITLRFEGRTIYSRQFKPSAGSRT
ncbi:MAG: hypothetical protein HKL92_00465 [Candidatus Eremiobacteraeota bacterium]|nr:hypothetical protein [Candidatus Eremiobacteraeota bacterium]NNM91792.1 hypothetical protein [Candidatus Eremiobacteraeota bacterium]